MKQKERQKLLEQVEKRVPEWASLNRSILAGFRGSDAHGTKLENTENSYDDTDVFVIVVQPVNFYLSLDNNGKKQQHWDSSGEELDILVYDIRKAFGLLTQSNPNVMNWLWNREKDYIHMSRFGMELIDNRRLFLTKKIFPRLIGYANGQKKRMQSEQKYQGYMGEKRKSLVNEYGYDIKNAAHVVRLLGMVIEIGTTGEFSSFRPYSERQLIKSIKSGEYSLKEITNIIEEYEQMASEAEQMSDLPEKPHMQDINTLLINIIRNYTFDYSVPVAE